MTEEDDGRWYLVEWEPDENDEPYDDSPSWEPERALPPSVVDNYTRMQEALTARACGGLDLRPLVSFVRAQMASKLKACVRADLAAAHSIPLHCAALAPIAVAFMHIVACPNALPQYTAKVSVRDLLSLPKLPIIQAADGSLQVKYTNMQDIARFCSLHLGLGKDKAKGALRYDMGRTSNQDMQVVAPPLVFTAKPDRKTDGTFNVTMAFNTVFINGKFGTPRFPRATKGLIKKARIRDSVVRYVRKIIPDDHHLSTAGWTQLPISQYEFTAEAAVPCE